MKTKIRSKSENDYHSSPSKHFFPPANVQAKLKIGQRGDAYEKEADSMANEVVQKIGTKNETSSKKVLYTRPHLQKRTKNSINSKHLGGDETANESMRDQLDNSNGKGASLPENSKNEMGSAFGTDFSDVRIHQDSASIQMNQQLHSRAFTHGSDIYFNRNEFRPSQTEGKRLLAHELTHVVQQSNSKQNAIQKVELTYDDGPDANGETQKTLDILNKTGAKATFYVVGRRIENGNNWKVIFNIAKSGNWLGNHAFDWNMKDDNHVFLNGSVSEQASKIIKTEFSIINALKKGKAEALASTNQSEWKAIPSAQQNYINDIINGGSGRFRTPGFRSKFWNEKGKKTMAAIGLVNEILEAAGLRKIRITKVGFPSVEGVTVDPQDWQKGRTKTEIEDAVKDDLSDNDDSILLHSRIKASTDATPAIIKKIKDEGYSFDPTIRGKRSAKTNFGFNSIKKAASSPNWVDKFSKQVSPIGYKNTVNKTDPVDRQVITSIGLVWAKHSNGKSYLTLVKIINSLVGGRPNKSTQIYFKSFVENGEIGALAIEKAKTKQPNGLKPMDWKYITHIPTVIPSNTEKK